jgi:hypothetical protein
MRFQGYRLACAASFVALGLALGNAAVASDMQDAPAPSVKEEQPVLMPPPPAPPAPPPARSSPARPPLMRPAPGSALGQFRASAFGEGENRAILIAGTITPGSYTRAKAVIEANASAKTLVLSSPGGSVIDGAAIAKLAAERGMNTYVPFMCASACTPIFTSGKVRTIAPGARLGFHQTYRTGLAELFSRNGPPSYGDAMLRLGYARAGLPESFIAKVVATPSKTMWYPSAKELIAARVATIEALQPALDPPSGVAPKMDDVLSDLKSKQFWTAAKSANPDIYAEAIHTIWLSRLFEPESKTAEMKGFNMIWGRLSQRFARFPDPVLNQFVSVAAGKVKEQGERRALCTDYMRSGAEFIDPQAKELTEAEAQLFLAIMAAPDTTPDMAEAEVLNYMANYAVTSYAAGGSMESGRSMFATPSCTTLRSAISALETMQPAERAKTVRAIFAYEEIARKNLSSVLPF